MKRKLAENLSALTILQLLNYVLPFVTLPYLIRVLGMENYGAYLFSQALVTYFLIFVDFGFDLYATRQIAIYKLNKHKVEEIVTSVFVCKAILISVSLVIIILVTSYVPILKEYQALHLINFGMIFGTVMFFNFYYQGIEEMKYITILNAGTKIIFIILIFIFVKNENDLILTASINTSGYILIGIISLWIIFKKHRISFVRVNGVILFKTLKESLPFFISRVAVSSYTVSNTLVIGLVLGNTAAGIFGTADKVFRGVLSLYTPLNTVFYPFIAHHKNVELYKKFMTYAIIANLFISVGIFICSEFIVKMLFGEAYIDSIIVLKMLSLALIYVLPHVLMGYPLLGGMGYTKEVNLSVVYASIIHVLLLIILIPFLSIFLVTILVLFTELLVFIIRLFYVRKYKLLN